MQWDIDSNPEACKIIDELADSVEEDVVQEYVRELAKIVKESVPETSSLGAFLKKHAVDPDTITHRDRVILIACLEQMKGEYANGD